MTTLPEEAVKALNTFSFYAQQWGWQSDQGYNQREIDETKANFDASYAVLEKLLAVSQPSAAREFHGPFGYIVGHRDLKEDYWQLESDPVTDADVREGIFSVPLYALTDPFKEIGVDGAANAISPAALEPSAGRAAVLEEIIELCKDYAEDSQPDSEYRLACNDIIEAIQEPRTLSSPDHADAGKVEGDGKKWPMREIVAKAIAYHSVGDPHAKTIRGDQRWEWFVEEADKFISVFGYYMPALPSPPASEGAE